MFRLLAALGMILVMVVTMDRVLASSLGEMLRHSSDRFMTVYRQAAPAEKGPAETVDVVVLGNSRADNHFPALDIQNVTCGKTLNLGMGGAPTTIADLLWHDYVERHGAPRLLLLEPTSVVDPPHTLADVPLLSYYSERVDDFVRQVDYRMWASNQVFNTLIFNNNQTIRLAMGLLRPADDRTLSGTMSPFLRQQIEHLPTEEMVGFQPNWEALDRIVATAREHGTKVAVVITPFYPGYIKKVSNFDAFFEDLKRRLPPDVSVIDARHAVEGDEHFADALHINHEGVRVMLAHIEDRLRPLGNCPADAIAQLGTPTIEHAAARP